jgi:hypothetical protein
MKFASSPSPGPDLAKHRGLHVNLYARVIDARAEVENQCFSFGTARHAESPTRSSSASWPRPPTRSCVSAPPASTDRKSGSLSGIPNSRLAREGEKSRASSERAPRPVREQLARLSHRSNTKKEPPGRRGLRRRVARGARLVRGVRRRPVRRRGTRCSCPRGRR